MTRKFVFFLAFALAMIAARPAAAFTYLGTCDGAIRWSNNDVVFRPSLVSFPQGSSWYNSVEAMRLAWNSYSPGGNYRINHTWDTNESTSNTDNRNSILMASSNPGAQWDDAEWEDALAVTLPRRSMCYFWGGTSNWVEMDIVFNPDYTWETSTNPAPPHSWPYNSTIVGVHEHGHAMGLGHEDDLLATMNSYYPVGGVIGTRNDPHPHADDARGDRNLYGTSATQRDVAASAFRRRLGAPGESEIIPAPYSVHRNTTTSFQFTVENRGTTDQSSIPVYFYLSPTRNVTTSSFLLGSTTLSMNYGSVTTGNAWVTIPSWAPTGYQYFGWIIDPNNGITESDEGNNGVAMAYSTYVSPNSAPNACMSASPTSGSTPLYVNFNAGCSNDPNGDALTYTWDFGDGTTGTGVTTSHSYYFAGYFTVTLTVTDSSGASSTTYQNISATCSGTRCMEEPQ